MAAKFETSANMEAIFEQIDGRIMERFHSRVNPKTRTKSIPQIAMEVSKMKKPTRFHVQVPDGEELTVTTDGGYTYFRMNVPRIKMASKRRRFFFEGPAATRYEKQTLTVFEANIALGIPYNWLQHWISKGEFPTPIGRGWVGNVDATKPLYTVREVIVYLSIMEAQIGNPKNHHWWISKKDEVRPLLFAAREEMVNQIKSGKHPEWRLAE